MKSGIIKIFGLLILLVILQSCGQDSQKPFDLEKLPNDWIRLTEIDSRLIIYNTCDAGNLLLTINEKELLLHGQQEDYQFEILKSVETKNDTILVKTKWKNSDELQDFRFVWIDKDKGLGNWITTYSNGFNTNFKFITSEKQSDYKTIEQPCKECWGEECNDEVEITTIEQSDLFASKELKKFSITELDNSSQYFRQLNKVRELATNSKSVEFKANATHNDKNSYYKNRKQRIDLFVFEFNNSDSLTIATDRLFASFPNDGRKISEGVDIYGKFTPSIYIINNNSIFIIRTSCEDSNNKWTELILKTSENFANNDSKMILTECGKLFWTSKEKIEKRL